jgi:transcriptional regulator with XRE-family HTH domain
VNDKQSTATDTVAANIRAEMARQRLSQSAIAIEVGMSPAAISQRLSGKTAINVDELLRLARVLNVPAGSLLGDAA